MDTAMHDIYKQLKTILRDEYVDIQKTEKKLEEIEIEAKKAGPQFEHFRLACLNNLKHEHAIAIDYANRALEIATEDNDSFLLEHLHTLLGFIAYNRGDFEKCMEHYLMVLKQVQSPRVINNIGAIFDDLNDMHEAYGYYRQAEEVFDDPLNFRLLAIIYCNIAECETAFGNYAEAKRYLNLSQAQIKQFTKKDGTTYIYNALGDLALIQKDYDEAIKHYSKGEAFARDESILVYYQKFILNHAKALFAKGDYKAAKERIHILLENSKQFNFDTNIPAVHELLAKIADTQKEAEIANKHYRTYIDLIREQDEISRLHRSESIKISIKMSQLHTKLDALNKLSRTDALTGLGNRFALREYMDVWKKTHKASPSIIALFDIDYFKRHNDTFGHAHGDSCLVRVAQILNKHLSTESGGIFRYGGDEFLVTLVGSDVSTAQERLELARKAIESETLSSSIGVVTVEATCEQSFEDLFNIADRALYISKDQGRNRITLLNSK